MRRNVFRYNNNNNNNYRIILYRYRQWGFCRHVFPHDRLTVDFRHTHFVTISSEF